MKKFKNRLTLQFSFLLAFSTACIAQKTSSPLTENQWHIQPLRDVTGDFFVPRIFKHNLVYLNDGAIGAVRFIKEEWGAVRMSREGKVMWQMKVGGPAIGICKFGEHILLFYSDEETSETFVKTITAVLIDSATGKKINEKKIFDNGTRAYIDARPLIRQDGSFAHLLVRVSNSQKRKLDPAKELKERLTSAKAVLLDVQQDLSVKTIDIPAAGKDGYFLGVRPGENDGFFFCSLLNDQVTVERFQKSGLADGKLSTPVNTRPTYPNLQPVTAIDPFNPQVIFVGLHYIKTGGDRMNQSAEFNFETKKITGTGEEALDKEYRKSLDPTKIPSLKNGVPATDLLKVIDIVASKDKIAIIKEVQYSETSLHNSNANYSNDMLVISIYNRQWKLLKTISFDKKNETNTAVGRSVGINLRDEKIYLIMPALAGSSNFATLYAVVDLHEQKLEAFNIIDKAGVSKSLAIEAGASLWFQEGALIEYIVEKPRREYHSVWQKVTF